MPKDLNIPILYHSKTSVCSQKVRLVLAELEVNWCSQVLDLKRGEQFEPQYLGLNPNASVPTYKDGSHVLTESSDIMVYLSRRHSEKSRLTITPEIKSSVNDWLAESIHFHTAVHVITTLAMNRQKLAALNAHELEVKLNLIPDKARAQRIRDVAQNGLQGQAAKGAVNYVKNIFRKLNTELMASRFLCGDNITLADLAILPFVFRLNLLDLKPDWSGGSFDALDQWTERLRQRPSFENAVMKFHGQDVADKYRQSGQKIRNEIIGQEQAFL